MTHHIWKFKGAYLPSQEWIEPAFVTISLQFNVVSVSSECSQNIEKNIDAYLLPGFVNAHCHAFQYSMAGQAERADAKDIGQDDFWTWRQTMYGLAESMTPDLLFKAASRCYELMLRHGITRVTEFHYLHHQPGGLRYKRQTEMAEQLLSAAESVGINLTMVPVYYQQNSLDGSILHIQKRFRFEHFNDYMSYLNELQTVAAGFSNAIVGSGAHSLRAVGADICKEIFHNQKFPGPRHIHAAEQKAEVSSCIKYLQTTPIKWLLDNTSLDENCHIVHATHATKDELAGLVEAQANVVLCPSTEANLGDGFFDLEHFRNMGGSFSIGTDSCVGMSLFEELRWLDYGLRLQKEKRVVLARDQELDSAKYLFKQMIVSGRGAGGLKNRDDWFATGLPLDATLIDPSFGNLQNLSVKDRIAHLIYCGDISAIKGTIVSGKLKII